MNVLLITARADIGGGPKSTYTIASGLSNAFTVFVASPEDEPYFNIYKSCPSIRSICVIPHRSINPLALWRLLSFIKKNNIDLINSNGNGAGLYARTIKLFYPKVKIVHTFRGLNVKDSQSWKRKLYFQYERWASKITNRFINVSAGEQQECLRRKIITPAKSSVVYNGIDPIKKTAPDKIFTSLKDRFVVVSLSRFDYQKNMQLSLSIAKMLRDYPNIHFVWIGDGPDKESVEQAIAAERLSNITLVGFNTEVGSFLPYADLYLSTARWEGLPLALLEAASVGLPILATDVIGNNEVVTHKHNGFLFSPDIPDQAVKQIISLYNDYSMLDQLSENVKQTFFEKFSKGRMIKETEKVYQQTMK